MSADNWATCPSCRATATTAFETKAKAVNASYGKVSPAEYMQAVKALANAPELIPNETLREDYELGIDPEGEFEVTYRAYCSVCSFNYKFHYSFQIPPDWGGPKKGPTK
jgi:hypothetical protein